MPEYRFCSEGGRRGRRRRSRSARRASPPASRVRRLSRRPATDRPESAYADPGRAARAPDCRGARCDCGIQDRLHHSGHAGLSDIHNPCSGGIFAPTVHAHDTSLRRRRRPAGSASSASWRCASDATFRRLGTLHHAARPAWPSPPPWQPSRSSRIAIVDYPETVGFHTHRRRFLRGRLRARRGAKRRARLDLSQVSAEHADRRPRGRSGEAAGDILGDPLSALLWLSERRRATRVGPSETGQIVLLGSLVQTNWIEPGQVVTVKNDALGQVRVRFQ